MQLSKAHIAQIKSFLQEFIARFVAKEKRGDAIFYLNRMAREVGVKDLELEEE